MQLGAQEALRLGPGGRARAHALLHLHRADRVAARAVLIQVVRRDRAVHVAGLQQPRGLVHAVHQHLPVPAHAPHMSALLRVEPQLQTAQLRSVAAQARLVPCA